MEGDADIFTGLLAELQGGASTSNVKDVTAQIDILDGDDKDLDNDFSCE